MKHANTAVEPLTHKYPILVMTISTDLWQFVEPKKK